MLFERFCSSHGCAGYLHSRMCRACNSLFVIELPLHLAYNSSCFVGAVELPDEGRYFFPSFRFGSLVGSYGVVTLPLSLSLPYASNSARMRWFAWCRAAASDMLLRRAVTVRVFWGRLRTPRPGTKVPVQQRLARRLVSSAVLRPFTGCLCMSVYVCVCGKH